MQRTPWLVTALSFIGAALSPLVATASPWVLPPGKLVVLGRYDYEVATEEFLGDREAVPFSLDGRYSASTYTFGVRLGLTSKVELQFEMPIKQVNYTADPVILLPSPGDQVQSDFDFYQENIINLNRGQTGIGDLRMTARYQLTGGQWASALELTLKTPTGYDRPEGTFGDRPATREAFLSDIAGFTNPDNVSDDVTLGDGQLDLVPRLLLGWATSVGFFARADIGYALRFGGAGDQVVGSVKAGQRIGERVLVYAGVDGEFAVTDGKIIGVSVAAEDPTLPAEEYGGLDNLFLRELRLERDRVVTPVGVIFRVVEGTELNLGYTPVVWGRNTSKIQSFSFGVAVTTPWM
ncbi:MAG: hypothetical protein ACE366_02420 [Bradymonadia bacterium]